MLEKNRIYSLDVFVKAVSQNLERGFLSEHRKKYSSIGYYMIGGAIVLVIACILIGCSEKKAAIQPKPVAMDSSEWKEETSMTCIYETPVTFSKAVALSDSIAIAEYIGCEKTDMTVKTIDYQFRTVESLRGELEAEIHLFEQSDRVDRNSYEIGKQYVLLMEKSEQSLGQDVPHYILTVTMYIPMQAIAQGRLQDVSISAEYGITDEEKLREAISAAPYTGKN